MFILLPNRNTKTAAVVLPTFFMKAANEKIAVTVRRSALSGNQDERHPERGKPVATITGDKTVLCKICQSLGNYIALRIVRVWNTW